MPNKLLDEKICAQIKELFDNQLIHSVEILYFSKVDPCKSCDETQQLLEEIIALSGKLQLRYLCFG